jgi:hypothetical protein
MKHVFFCGTRLRAVIVLTIAAAAFAIQAGNAFAVSEVAQPSPQNLSHATQPVLWTGQVLGAANPSDCTSPFEVAPPDSDVFVCSVETLKPLEAGQAEVVVKWADATANLALWVYECIDPTEFDTFGQPLVVQVPNPDCHVLGVDASGNPTGFSNQNPFTGILEERVAFQARAFNAVPGSVLTYEARTIPIDAPAPVDYSGCAAYLDGSDKCPNNPALNTKAPKDNNGTFPNSAFLACTQDSTGKRRMNGSGEFRDSSNNKIEHAEISVRQRDNGKPSQGQINHRSYPDKTKFHSKRLACVSFHDGTKSVDVTGIGYTQIDGQKKEKVCFRATFQDSGQKTTGDNYSITTVPFFRNDLSTTADDTCGAPGAVQTNHTRFINKGDFRYGYDGGSDCEYDEYDRDAANDSDSNYGWSNEQH